MSKNKVENPELLSSIEAEVNTRLKKLEPLESVVSDINYKLKAANTNMILLIDDEDENSVSQETSLKEKFKNLMNISKISAEVERKAILWHLNDFYSFSISNKTGKEVEMM